MNYHHAKAKLTVARVFIAKCEITDAESLASAAKSIITSIFSDEHPLAAKYNETLIECYHLKEDSSERS